jgi:hypothetical protein
MLNKDKIIESNKKEAETEERGIRASLLRNLFRNRDENGHFVIPPNLLNRIHFGSNEEEEEEEEEEENVRCNTQ